MSDYLSTAEEHVVASYRYLRLSIVILAASLGVSLWTEIRLAPCWLGSISAYYHTPVHSLFVGALVAIGVILVSLQGRHSVENLSFNLAGVLAIVVALVPTDRPESLCSSGEVKISTPPLVSNNVPALFAGVALAILVLVFIIIRELRQGKPQPGARVGFISLGFSVALFVSGWWWYQTPRAGFKENAHDTAAILMFVAVWFAAMVNTGWVRHGFDGLFRLLGEDPSNRESSAPRPRCQYWYRGVCVFMPLVGLGVLITVVLNITWVQRVFWLEVLEIAPFTVFWLTQTIEGWNSGVEGLPAEGR